MSVPVSKPRKVIYLVIGGMCLTLGVIGLIVPIVPGVLFLMAAVYLLSRASAKIKNFTDRDPRILLMQQRMEQFAEVDAIDRIRLTGWMTLDAIVKGVQAIGTGCSRVARMVSQRVSC